MVENAGRVRRHVADMDRERFGSAELVRDAAERCIERVVEAVRRLGPAAETPMPGQPWANIRGMANRLRHAYDRIDVDRIRDTVQSDLPRLQAAAAAALARLTGEQGSTGVPSTQAKERPS